jgi:hypothetical protein
MKRYVISGLALALAVSGGCTSTHQAARLDSDVEMVLPTPTVAYVPPANTATTVIAARPRRWCRLPAQRP